MSSTNFTNEEKFEIVYQKLSDNYNAILENMASVGNLVKRDSKNIELKDLLYNLAEVATKIIGTQISFAYAYGDEKTKEIVVNKLSSKRQMLLSEIATELRDIENKRKAR